MFKYLNLEPNDEKLNDCVIRAMTLALAVPYDEIVQKLYDNGKYNNCEEVCLTCYEQFLNGLGYIKISTDKFTVEDISNLYPNKVMLIRIDGHLTCSIDGNIYDIWDCSNERANCYWIIE